MSKRIQSIRGMHDILPARTPAWEALETALRDVVTGYGYREIRLPIVEPTELFARSIGEVTDIVEKEMYTFEDRNGDSLTLRPEGTAGCARAGIEHSLLHNQRRRLWYTGPMFRHERPQKGRYRQFHQIGVEAFGMPGPGIDAELILMSARMWRVLGLKGVRLEINTLGSAKARAQYRERLIEYWSAHRDRLDEDAKRRLHSNPLRVLDSKNPDMQALIADAPPLPEALDETSLAHFEELKRVLDAAGIVYTVNPRLVRGLDYYTRTVFEWITDALGAQGAICAGGRYDGLVERLGGGPVPAAGFAVGLERLLTLLETQGVQSPPSSPHAYLVTAGEAAVRMGQVLAEHLRDALPRLRLEANVVDDGFKAQLKRADRSGAELALILGDEEVAGSLVAVKFLRTDEAQQTIGQSELPQHLRAILSLE